MKHRVALVLLALLLLLGGAACAKKTTEPTATPAPEPAATAEPTAAPTPEPAPAPTVEPTPVPSPAVMHTVTWYDHGGKNVLAGPTQVEEGGAVPAVADPALDRYKFAYWKWYTANGTALDAAPETVTEDVFATAMWYSTLIRYSVVWYAADGTTVLTSAKLAPGASIPGVSPPPVAANETFVGWKWYSGSAQLGSAPTAMPKSDLTAIPVCTIVPQPAPTMAIPTWTPEPTTVPSPSVTSPVW